MQGNASIRTIINVCARHNGNGESDKRRTVMPLDKKNCYEANYTGIVTHEKDEILNLHETGFKIV